MKKIALLILTVVMTLKVSAQSTCSDRLHSFKKDSYFNKLNDDAQNAAVVTSGFGGLVLGISFAGANLPGFLIVASIASSPILVGEAIKGIQNRPLNRMIKLIKQAEKFAQDPSQRPGRLLRKLHKRLESSKIPRDISILELAMTISDANKDFKKCGALRRLRKVDDKINDGSITVVELGEELDSEG
jgi:hypothetical protein